MRTPLPLQEYSVERRLKTRGPHGENIVSNADVLEAIEGLRADLKTLRGDATAAPAAEAEGPLGQEEALAARVEIAQMVRVIGQAKLEIASIKHPMSDDDRIRNAASEMDTIVLATEASTNDILNAAETIENLTRQISGRHHDDEELVDLTDHIANEIIKIFEACNFQDITGQRITKVVKTLRFIEERILAMIEIWGMEAFSALPMPERSSAKDDTALMNGPQLGNQGISQDDINALFD